MEQLLQVVEQPLELQVRGQNILHRPDLDLVETDQNKTCLGTVKVT